MSTNLISLSGLWQTVKDEQNNGIALGWEKEIPPLATQSIRIPAFADQGEWDLDESYSSVYSRYHGYVWYYRSFRAEEAPSAEERFRLEFDRAGYVCQVWLNGRYLGEHRQHEDRFSFDVTDVLSVGGDNLLAVRCFEPVCGQPELDGITLDKIPNGFFAGDEDNEAAPFDCVGGILGEVRLLRVPDPRIEDVYVRADPKDGCVTLQITLSREAEGDVSLPLRVQILDQTSGECVSTVTEQVVLGKGRRVITQKTVIPNHKTWELTAPALYVAHVYLGNGAAHTLRFGFKEMYVKNGFFYLNGKRILLKFAHGTPTAQTVISMKAMGFHGFRSIQRVMDPEVMDLCDQLGMLIIEAPLTAWGMRYHEHTAQMIEDAMTSLVLAHRNHVCVGFFYFLNELKRRQTLEAGIACLPKLRELDPDRLYLLSSGRWDPRYDLGSVCNPGSVEWEPMFAAEGDLNYPHREVTARVTGITRKSSLSGGKGDLHLYPVLPLDAATKRWYRTVGADTAPIFCSEFGLGSQANPMRTYFRRLAAGKTPEHDSLRESLVAWQSLEKAMEQWGLSEVYPFATDFCRESDRMNGRQRSMMFDLIRSNPQICGLGLTSWGISNEGTLEDGIVIKDGLAYALQEGLAPLRLALFSSERVVYADHPFEIEAVLCNEDVLPPNDYRAQAVIKGDHGVAYRRDFTASYPSNGYGGLPPLAAEILRDKVSLSEGEYTFSVRLLEGAAPFSTELPITALRPAPVAPLPRRIAAWGLSESMTAMLNDWQVETIELCKASTPRAVFVGLPKCDNPSDTLTALAEQGITVIFTDSRLFKTEAGSALLKQIAGTNAALRDSGNWIYHFDLVHAPHPILARIHESGILDIEYMGESYPRDLFMDTELPAEPICTALRVDEVACTAAMAAGIFPWKKGRAVLHSFQLDAGLGKNPLAEQFLLNLITTYA